MPTDASSSPPEISYAIEYQVFAGREYNEDFRGQGRLVIRPAGPSYVFSGKRRTLFSGESIEREFSADDIWNVSVSDRTIRFRTRNSGSAKPFFFLCQDAHAAAEVAGLLPSHVDEDFAATQDFASRLHALPAAASPWTSVTNVLVALNVAVFIVMGALGAGWFEVASMKPYVLYGANNGGVTTNGEWWRLVSCMFMHYGLIHLALNMWALFQVGHLLERLLGRALYTLTYLGSGVVASLASIIWHGDKIWSAGASGAVFGAYGALLGYMLREKHGVPKAVFQPILRSTLTFAGYNIFYGMVHPTIDNSAHVGGLLSGLVLGWLIALPLDPLARRQLFSRRLQAGLVTVALLVTAGIGLAPRFDYSMAEEMKWSEVTKDFSAKEVGIGTRQNDEWREFIRTGGNRTTYGRWIEDELIPLHERFAQQLEEMQLTPGKLTARRREVILQYTRLRLAGYRHLLVGVRERNEAELKSFADFNHRAQAELDQLPKEKK